MLISISFNLSLLSIFKLYFDGTVFVEILFVTLSDDSATTHIISSQIIIESSTSYRFTIFTNTHSRIPNLTFFAHMFFQVFTLTQTFVILLLIWATFSTIKLAFTLVYVLLIFSIHLFLLSR